MRPDTNRTAPAMGGASLLTPDLEDATAFLAALDPTADAYTFATFADLKGSRAITDTKSASLIDAAPLLIAANRSGSGVFVAVNAMDASGSRKLENFAKVRAIWAELDHGKPDQPWPLEPSIVVESSPGKYHVYWLVSDDMPRETHLAIERRLCADWKADPNAIDLTRVLRVPGFWHRKATPWQVRLVECDPAKRYTTADICASFPPLAPVATTTMKAFTSHNAADDADFADVQSALDFLADKTTFEPDPDGVLPLCVDDRRTWIAFGMALKREFGEAGFGLWEAWSSNSEKYDSSDMSRRWDGFPLDAGSRSRGVTVGSIFGLAKRHGWQRPSANPFATVQAVAADPAFAPSDSLTAREWAQKVTDWNTGNVAELMQRMAQQHAFIEDGQEWLHQFPDGAKKFLTTAQMKNLYAGIFPHGRGSNAFDAFAAWSGVKTWRSKGFFPGSEKFPASVPDNVLNTWEGLAVKPIKGDWSLTRRHLQEYICGGDAAAYDWYMDWNAHAVLKPQLKPGSAIVLCSPEEGTGKGIFANLLGSLFQRSNRQPVQQGGKLTGTFNASIEHSVVVIGDEADWITDPAASAVLKNLITEPEVSYEPKNKERGTRPNYTRFIFMSNKDHVVPAGGSARRYFVLRVRPFVGAADERSAYYTALAAELDNGGREAFLHDLMQRDVPDHFYHPPVTDALLEQKVASLDGVWEGLRDCIVSGAFHTRDGEVVYLSDDEPMPRDKHGENPATIRMRLYRW